MNSAQASAYAYRSRIGTFVIRKAATGWQIVHDGESLGNGYMGAQQALDALAGGHSDWPGTTDPSTLGLPPEIGDWTPLPAEGSR